MDWETRVTQWENDCPLVGPVILGIVSQGPPRRREAGPRQGETWHRWEPLDLVGIVIAGGGPGNLWEGH